MKRKKAVEESELLQCKKVRTENCLNIQDLPIEVIHMIFEHIPASSRKRVTEVSRTWLNIWELYYNKSYCIRLQNNQDFTENGELFKTFSSKNRVKQFTNLIVDTIKIFRPAHLGLLQLISKNIQNLELNCIRYKLPDLQKTFPMLQTLTFKLLPDSYYPKFPPSLRVINVDCPISARKVQEFKKLKANNPTIERVSCKKIEYISQNTTMFTQNYSFMNAELQELSNAVVSKGQFILKSNFNILSSDQMTKEDITGLIFSQQISSLSKLSSFKNLTELHFYMHQDISRYEPFFSGKFDNVKVLRLVGIKVPEYLRQLLRSFPNVEHLEIDQCPLRNTHISIICELQPRLKKLFLWDILRNCFTLSAFLNAEKSAFSLKNLPNLEELMIKTQIWPSSDYNSQRSNCQKIWPALDKLKKLTLVGHCFSKLAKRAFEKMSKQWKNVEWCHIDRGWMPKCAHYFIPLLENWGKHLTYFYLDEVGTNWFNHHRKDITEKLIDKGQNLKKIELKDFEAFHLKHICLLFKNIPTLEAIIIPRNGMNPITRYDFRNLKSHLRANFSSYLDNLTHTCAYVAKELMTVEQRYEIVKNLPQYLNKRTMNFYLTCHYLQFTKAEICSFTITLFNQLVDSDEEESDVDW